MIVSNAIESSDHEMKVDSLYDLAVVIDELKSVDVKKKINSLKNLSKVAVALGQKRTRLELLPYIKELIECHEEDFLVNIEEDILVVHEEDFLVVLAQILPE